MVVAVGMNTGKVKVKIVDRIFDLIRRITVVADGSLLRRIDLQCRTTVFTSRFYQRHKTASSLNFRRDGSI
jgi:hypothetical protein